MDRTAEQGVCSVVYFRVGYAVAGNNFQTWFCGSAIGGESESSPFAFCRQRKKTVGSCSMH